MKSTCVLPSLSDLLNPTTAPYYNHHQHHRNHHHQPQQQRYTRPSSHSVLQVSNLLTEEDVEDYDDEPVKAKRKRASPSQLSVLNRVFEQTFFPSTELRMELGKQLGMSPRTVQIWFQNKRQSIRTRERVVTHIASPPISPSIRHYASPPPPPPPSTNHHHYSQKPAHISLPPLRLPQPPTFPLTPSSSVQSSPSSFDNSILFRDY
ncbi:unnamed protein product [Mucor circinelloides]|uniref:Homeobox domain-containing protein n=2 Tax=Mucor TaxID=4830 RepID=S2J5R7_MUCC1|nr:hypothetical protein HMPREF1544_07729 [Mucor circinelloides 1006PhL]KAG1102600.1 hypothetical protein G6F42_017342 [Rhizopus arrhizus]